MMHARRIGALLGIALACAACAACSTATHNVERSYVRPNLAGLPLQTIDVVVFVAGPPRTAEPRLAVKSFDPPGLDEPLFVGAEDLATRDALAKELRAKLQPAGFTIRMIEASPEATSTATTASTSSTSVAPGDRLRTGKPNETTALALDTQTTLRALSKSSTADAILVVRAVPVDAFYLDFGQGTRIENTPLGRERIEDSKPVAYQGRLLLGQAFLLDRKTGLRLWTKQIPDFPEGGRLTPNHPFLAYGYVHDPKSGALPPPAKRATLAAHSFTASMLRDFPAKSEGSAAARAELDSVDVERESQLASFFDTGHLGLDAGVQMLWQRTDLNLKLAGTELDALNTGAVAPYGFIHAVPRALYLAPGGLVLSLAVPFGYAPSGFSRSYHLDNAMRTAGDPEDRSAKVKVDGTWTYGLEATIGIAHPLTRHTFLIPAAGLYGQLISISASPGTVVQDASRQRAGLVGRVDLLQTLPGAGDSIFWRIGAALEGGLDSAGTLVTGFESVLSVGVFL